MLEKGRQLGSFAVSTFGQRSSLAELSLREKPISCIRCVFKVKRSADDCAARRICSSHPHRRAADSYLFIGLCAAGMFPIALTASALMIENAIDEATSYFIAAASLGGACLSF